MFLPASPLAQIFPFCLYSLILPSSVNQLPQLFVKVLFSTPFPVAPGTSLNSLTVPGWKTLPGFVTLFLRLWFLRRKHGSFAKKDSAKQIEAAATELCPNKLSLVRMLMILEIILAYPICQVKHENVLNCFTSKEGYGELWGLGWWMHCNLTSFI